MKDFLNLLEISKSDISSSRILYKNNQFSQSYFYFQQASEKANKAIWLLFGEYNKDELQKIGHNQFKPIRKGAFKLKSQIDLLESIDENLTIFSEHPLFKKLETFGYREQIKSSVSFFDNLHQYDLVNLQENELVDLLKSLDGIENINLILPEDFDENFKKLLSEQASWDEKFYLETNNPTQGLGDILANENEYERFKTICIEKLKISMELLYCHLCLLFCSLLTVQHSSATRYPDYIKKTNPLNIYNKELPIVKKQAEFLAHLENAINKLIQTYKN